MIKNVCTVQEQIETLLIALPKYKKAHVTAEDVFFFTSAVDMTRELLGEYSPTR